MQFKFLKPFGRIISRYKYTITIVVCTAIVVFLDENSFLRRLEYNFQIRDLKAEIEKYNTEYERDSIRLYELKGNPKAITKVARERYFMKADDEDIFVLSDDSETNDNKDEKTK